MERVLQETFLAERYWPGVGRADLTAAEERLRRAVGELTRDGIAIRVVSSTWILADEVVLTLFEAVEEDDVLEVSRRGAYPFDRLQRVEVLTDTEMTRRGRDDGEHDGGPAWAGDGRLGAARGHARRGRGTR